MLYKNVLTHFTSMMNGHISFKCSHETTWIPPKPSLLQYPIVLGMLYLTWEVIPDPHSDSRRLHAKCGWDSQFTMLQFFKTSTVLPVGPGQVLVLTISPRRTCAMFFACLTVIPLSLFSGWYAFLTNGDIWEVYL